MDSECFSFYAKCSVWYWFTFPYHIERRRHIHLVEASISITLAANKPPSREEADLLGLPISSLRSFAPLPFSGWLEHLFLLLQKTVCLP